MLEDFVEAILAGALERIADEGWGPAEEDPTDAFFGVDGAPSLNVGAIELGVNLTAAFDLWERASAQNFKTEETALSNVS